MRTLVRLLSGMCLMASALAQPTAEQKKLMQPTAEQRKIMKHITDVVYSCVGKAWRASSEIKSVRVKLQIRLEKDGSLAGTPEVINPEDTREGKFAAETAIGAVRACAPFKLPPEAYDSWKAIRVDFVPSPPLSFVTPPTSLQATV